MPSKVFSSSIFGFDCKTVEVEVDILNGPASMSIVGLGDASVQESKERIRSAIKNSELEYPRRKKTINLAPADLRKHGPLFDLPIALGLLAQSEQIPRECLNNTIVIGELSLDGTLRRVPGVLPIVAHAAECGFSHAIIPAPTAAEAENVNGIEIIPAIDLKSLVAHLRGEDRIPPHVAASNEIPRVIQPTWCFEDIRGHEYVKRALIIAAAGGHNILLYGPPGSGKTLLARSFQSVLPPLNFEESLDVTKIYSIAGKLRPEEPFITLPPFRAVHHTASTISLVGGGAIPRPGEISMAHKGVLFLDELLEFTRATLDCLRQPMEDGTVNVTRVAGSAAFPAEFTLVAACNPCPCGYLGDSIKACICTPSNIQRYMQKLSGPLLDRIDIMCYVPRLPFEKITGGVTGQSSAEAIKQVLAARMLQSDRYGAGRTNAKISSNDVRKHCAPSKTGQELLKNMFATSHYSGRSYYRILKTARTIADLENARDIESQHIAEALQYRPAAEKISGK